jgi:hypothetical protein
MAETVLFIRYIYGKCCVLTRAELTRFMQDMKKNKRVSYISSLQYLKMPQYFVQLACKTVTFKYN